MPIEASEPRSVEFKEQMNSVYSKDLHDVYETVSRKDFYGFVGEMTVEAFSRGLGLSKDSHVLDLCCGTGGPARYLAQRFACNVTGVDISEPNIQIARNKTVQAQLNDKVTFILGNALTTNIEGSRFSHVFGCDAWCYFPEKAPLYRTAFRALSPGGTIAFLDHSCEKPSRFAYEEGIGRIYFESKASYVAELKRAGFESIQEYDLTEVALKDLGKMVLAIIGKREPLAAPGLDRYTGFLEIWSEALASLSTGKTSYCGYIGRKP